MSDDVTRFLDRHVRRRLDSAGVTVDAAALKRLVSFRRLPMPGDSAPLSGDANAQVLARFELGFRHGDVVVELNARDAQPMSWLFAKLAEGEGATPDAASALATATASAQPPADAVLVHAAFEDIGGRSTFVAHWEHHHQGVVVERDYIRVLVSGGTGRVFAVHRHWHAVDPTPTER